MATPTPDDEAEQVPALKAACAELAQELGTRGVSVKYGQLDMNNLTALVEARAVRDVLVAGGYLHMDDWEVFALKALRGILADALQQVEEQALRAAKTMSVPVPKGPPIAIARALPRRRHD